MTESAFLGQRWTDAHRWAAGRLVAAAWTAAVWWLRVRRCALLVLLGVERGGRPSVVLWLLRPVR